MLLTRVALAALLALSAVTVDARARVEAQSRYTKTQTYHGALRYLRVDLDCEVTEHDEEAAYLMFRYQIPGRKTMTHGTIEIVETPKAVRVFVQLPKLPQYHEQVLKDGLMKKLGDDYGEPPKKAPKKAPTKSQKDDSARQREGEGTDEPGEVDDPEASRKR